MTHFVDTEAMQRAAHAMASATDDACRIAGRIEESTHSLNVLFQDGYDSNALRLLALLQDSPDSPVTALLNAISTLSEQLPAPGKADAVWLNFPANTPVADGIYLTNAGALHWESALRGGAWLTPEKDKVWTSEQHGHVTRFLKCQQP